MKYFKRGQLVKIEKIVDDYIEDLRKIVYQWCQDNSFCCTMTRT